VYLSRAKLIHIRARHDEFADRLDDIRSTVERPDFVTRDRLRDHRECFYREETPGEGLIKVVVHYRPIPPQGTWTGEIITAFPVGLYRFKEVKLWP
jgi:hypothetical protein